MLGHRIRIQNTWSVIIFDGLADLCSATAALDRPDGLSVTLETEKSDNSLTSMFLDARPGPDEPRRSTGRKEPRRGWIRSRGVGATPLHDLHEVACVSAQLQRLANQTMRWPAPSPIDAARFRPGPGLVLSCAPHRIPPLPPTPSMGQAPDVFLVGCMSWSTPSFPACPCSPQILGQGGGRGARLTRARASSFGSSWNPRVTWRRVSFVDYDRQDRYSETWMI